MPARILIADDSPLILKSLRTLLESQPDGWRVCSEAADGPQTLQKALQTKPDLIIIDFQMPLMDGLRTSARIRKFLPGTPILINTIHKSAYLESEAKKVGVREVVSKPDSVALLRAVNESLGSNPVAPASGRNKAD